jgi:hypothetical protein
MIKSPIFIVGVGRSGTTLLQGMMNSHQNITFPPETQFIRNFITQPRTNKKIKKKDFEWVKKTILKDKNLKELNINLNNILEKSVNAGEMSLSDFYKELLVSYSEKKKKELIGDKYPKNIEYLREISMIFPDANIIHIIRDPRDVVLSRLKAHWSKGRPVFIQALTYRLQLKKGRKDGKNYFPNQYYEIFYEDLIENPEKELKKLCEFLKLDFDQNMLQYNKNAKEIVKNEETEWKSNIFKPVISSNKNKWMSQLKKTQVFQIEFLCSQAFNELYYNKSNFKVGFSWLYFLLFYPMAKGADILYAVYQKIKFLKSKKYLHQ